MSARMLRADVTTPAKSAEFSVASASNSDNSDAPLADIDLDWLISTALARIGMKHAEACEWMQITPSQWSKQLKSQDNAQVSLQKLSRLPRAFWCEFIALLADAVQLTVSHPDFETVAMRRVVELVAAIGQVFEQSRSRRIA